MKIPVTQGRSFMRSIVSHRTQPHVIKRTIGDELNDRGGREPDNENVNEFIEDLWLYAPNRNRTHEEFGLIIDGDLVAVGTPDVDLQENDTIIHGDREYNVETIWTTANDADNVLKFANLQLKTR